MSFVQYEAPQFKWVSIVEASAAVVFTVAQVLVRSLVWIPIGLGLLILIPIGYLFYTSTLFSLAIMYYWLIGEINKSTKLEKSYAL